MARSPARPRSLWRLLLGLFLATGFVLSAVPALILFNVQRRAFDPATYPRALASTDFYRQFPVLLADRVQQNLGPSAPGFLKRITADQWRIVMVTLLPERQLQLMAEDATMQALAFINGDAQQLNITLSPLKQSLTGPAGLDAALYILHAQPDCTVEQAAAMLYSPGNEICNPPKAMLEMLSPLMQAELQNVAAALPDQVTLGSSTANPQVRTALADIRVGRWLMQTSPLIPLFFWFVLTVVMVRTVRDWLAWWGWPLLVTGLTGVPSSLMAGPILALLFERSILKTMSLALPSPLTDSLRSVVGAILGEMLKPVILESAVLCVIGAAMVAASFLVRRRPARGPVNALPGSHVS